MKKQIIHLLFAAITLITPFTVHAQYGLDYNQLGQLRNSFNGSLSMMDPEGGAALLTRQQWVGMDGAPQVYWASGHMGIQNLGMTVGVDIKQAGMGVVKDRELSVYAASAVRLSDDQYIALSVGGGLLLHNGNYSTLDPGDPSFAHGDAQYSQGMMSIGTSYFREDKYYVGVSIPRFLLSRRGRDLEYDFQNVYYLTGGLLWEVDEGFHIRPSLTVSHVETLGSHYDVNALAFFAQKFGMGVGVQNRGQLSGLLQLNIGGFGIGYSYQFNVNSASSNQYISNNTHEIGLRYRIGGIKML